MGLSRRAAKRDGNEPAIYSYWRSRGAYLQSTSSTGQPDTIVWWGGVGLRAETKTRRGRLKPAQVKEFTAAFLAGVKTFIVRNQEDAKALLGGTLQPWEPGLGDTGKPRAFRPGRDKARSVADLCKADHCGTSRAPGLERCMKHALEQCF